MLTMPLSTISRGDWVMNTTAPLRLRMVRSCFSMMLRKVGSISARHPSSQGISNGVPSSNRNRVIEICEGGPARPFVVEQRRRVEPVQTREPDGVDRSVDDPAELVVVAPLFE